MSIFLVLLNVLTVLNLVKSSWVTLISRGTYGEYLMPEADFNALAQMSTHFIIRRDCASCASGWQEIYYRRFTDTDAFTPYSYLTSYWFSTNNVLGTNFGLYSTLEDALSKTNIWTFCNYDDSGVGFPRDCGPTGYYPWQWNSFTRTSGQWNVRFSLYVENYLHLIQRGSYGDNQALSEDTFNSLFQGSNRHIIRRECADCDSSWQDIYYHRLTNPTSFTPYSYMTSYWYSANNILGTDFELHNNVHTSDHSHPGNTGWTFCNYDDPGVGFPRDCGPTGYHPWQWSSLTCTPHGCGRVNIQFSLYLDDDEWLDLAASSSSDSKSQIITTQKNHNSKFLNGYFMYGGLSIIIFVLAIVAYKVWTRNSQYKNIDDETTGLLTNVQVLP